MGYTAFDQFVAWRRFCVARPQIRAGTRVCDIGCGLDAKFLHYMRHQIRFGVGIDYQAAPPSPERPRTLLADITRGFPFRSGQFDHAVMLAVLEHLSNPEVVLREIYRVLAPGGSLIMTWPSAAVDPILNVLRRVGVVSDEMESEKHERRIPLAELVAMLRAIGFDEFRHRRFELGLNNLMVAHKPR